MKKIYILLAFLSLLSCNPVEKSFDLIDLSKPVILESPEILLEFDDKYPVSIKVMDSLLFVIYVKADTCIDVYNMETKQKIRSLGPAGHGPDDLMDPNFILSDNYIVGRQVDGTEGKMFFIYNRAKGNFSEVNRFFDLKEPISDYNYAFASTIALNEQQNRIIAGMYFFDMIHIFDLEGRHIHTFRFSEHCIPEVNSSTKMLALGNGYSGFIRCFPTEKYCYLLRISGNPIKGKAEKMLIQTDWNGNLVNSYRFVENVSGQFYIDERTRKLYIIRNSRNADLNEEMFDVVSYDLQ